MRDVQRHYNQLYIPTILPSNLRQTTRGCYIFGHVTKMTVTPFDPP